MRHLGTSIGLIMGIAITGGLLLWSGLGEVLAILTTAGSSLLFVGLLALPEILAGSEAWRQLFPVDRRPGMWPAFRASWIGMAVNTLLPVATVGGEIVKARMLVFSKSQIEDVTAATLVDKTVQAMVTLLWGLVGLFVLARLTPNEDILIGGLIGAGLLALGIGGFIAVQMLGSFAVISRMTGGLIRRLVTSGSVGNGEIFDLAVRRIYQRPGALIRAVSLRLIGQIWLVSEVLLTTWLLGQMIGFEEALMLRALIGAVRGLSFVVPAGLGLQEGAYIVLGALIGLPAEMMLALSLASRLREVLPSLPGFLFWQQIEGRRFLEGRSREQQHVAAGGNRHSGENLRLVA